MKNAGDFPQIVSNRIPGVKPINIGFLTIFFSFFQLQTSSRNYQKNKQLGRPFLGPKYLLPILQEIMPLHGSILQVGTCQILRLAEQVLKNKYK